MEKPIKKLPVTLVALMELLKFWAAKAYRYLCPTAWFQGSFVDSNESAVKGSCIANTSVEIVLSIWNVEMRLICTLSSAYN